MADVPCKYSTVAFLVHHLPKIGNAENAKADFTNTTPYFTHFKYNITKRRYGDIVFCGPNNISRSEL